ncbi:MAG: lepB [Rhizobium sp.]|nr:lepB [Rhizobium sp.]
MDPLCLPTLVLAIIFRIAVIQPFSVQASSMAPTLEPGEYLLASKYSYGYSQFSLPMGANLPAFQVLKASAERGDVILFAVPGDPTTVYIKRVAGIAGDRVQIRDGITYINDVALQRTLIGPYKGKSDFRGIGCQGI